MSSLVRLFGALASEELSGITKESAKHPEFREVVTRSAGTIAATACADVTNNIRGTGPGDTAQSVDRAIVALVQYRDIIDPPAYMSASEATSLLVLEGQEREDRLVELSTTIYDYGSKSHERLASTQKFIAKTLRDHIATELYSEADADLKEQFGESVAKAIAGGTS